MDPYIAELCKFLDVRVLNLRLGNKFKPFKLLTQSQPGFWHTEVLGWLLDPQGEFCPYCAMERWALVMALDQFGNFTNLTPITSAEDHVPTYTFYGSSYTSSKIDFEPAEISNNVSPNSGSFQSMNALQNQLFNKYSPRVRFPLCV